MKILSRFSDDHLPCVKFEHNGTEFELYWTSNEIVAALEYAEESKRARTRLTTLMKKIENPDSIENEDENPDEPHLVTAFLEEGALMFSR